MEARTLRIDDLTELDLDLLRDEMREQGADPGDLTAEPLPGASPDQAGDFGVTAVTIVIGLAAVKAVAAWMAKHRSLTVEESTIETFDEDGRLVRRETIRHRSQASAPPGAEELKALGEMTNVDPKLLTAL